MALKCCACHKQCKILYCARCVNSSPALLLRLKLDLWQVASSRENVHTQVDGILNDALKGDCKKQEVLWKHLAMLKTTHFKRKTNKIRSKLIQLQQIVQSKRERVRALETCKPPPDMRTVNREYTEAMGLEFRESQERLRQLQRILDSSKALKFQQLVHLFLIRKRDHAEFPFTISFQPVVNVQNLCRLPQNVIECSLRSMWDFLLLAGRVLLIELPLQSRPENDVSDSLTGIVLNLLVLVQHLELLPSCCSDKRGRLRALLRQYDVDKLFYHMVMNQDITLRFSDQVHSVVDYEVCHSEIQALLQGSRELSVLGKSMDDKWFLVG